MPGVTQLPDAMPITNQFAASGMGRDVGCKRIRGANPNGPKNVGAEMKNANPKVGVFL